MSNPGAEKRRNPPEGESAVGRLVALLARYRLLADMCAHSRLAIQATALSRDMAGFFKRLLPDRGWQAFRFGPRFFVQGFGKFLQAGNDLRRLGQNR